MPFEHIDHESRPIEQFVTANGAGTILLDPIRSRFGRYG